MLDLTLTTVMPLLVSSVTAATFAYITTGTNAMFQFAYNNEFTMERIPYVILLGIFCGLVSLYFTRAMNMIENFLRKLNYWQKFGICSAILSILIFLLPPLYGEGYDTINTLLGGIVNSDDVLNNSFFYNFRDFPRFSSDFQGICLQCYQWRWRNRGNIRTLSVFGMYCRIRFRIHQ